MNKKLLIVMVSVVVLLVGGLTIAGVSLNARDTSVEISKEAKTQLDSMGLSNPETTELICGVEECKFKMYKGDFRLGEHTIPRKYCSGYDETLNEYNETSGECLTYSDYSQQELENAMDKKIEEALDNYGKVFKEREDRQAVEKTPTVGAGTITIGEKK